jgi:hypothetical protein
MDASLLSAPLLALLDPFGAAGEMVVFCTCAGVAVVSGVIGAAVVGAAVKGASVAGGGVGG